MLTDFLVLGFIIAALNASCTLNLSMYKLES